MDAYIMTFLVLVIAVSRYKSVVGVIEYIQETLMERQSGAEDVRG